MNRPTLPGLTGLSPGTIYCIGRNYAEHAAELNNPVPDEPVVFMKPSASITFDGPINIPAFVKEPHFEVELVVAMGRSFKGTDPEDALDAVAGYALGIDVTARDIQQQLKQKRLPWFAAKGLDTFAPLSSFIDKSLLPDVTNARFRLYINGELRQQGNTSDMIVPVGALLVHLSRYVTLMPGDLVFTGTPSGVGLLRNNDRLHACLDPNLLTLDMNVVHLS